MYRLNGVALFLCLFAVGCQSLSARQIAETRAAVLAVLGSARSNNIAGTAIIQVDPSGGIAFGPGATWNSGIKATVILQSQVTDIGRPAPAWGRPAEE